MTDGPVLRLMDRDFSGWTCAGRTGAMRRDKIRAFPFQV